MEGTDEQVDCCKKTITPFSREKSRQTFVIKGALNLFLFPNPFVIKKAISPS